jgi:hypothetical protein
VLELRPAQDPTDPGRLALGIFPEGARYRKHVLDLGGLGVRDLCPDGDDLLVLTGPTMALSGPVRVHRWRDAVADGGGPVVRDAELAVETVLTNGEGVDHPSAISLLGPDPLDARARLLVVYDNPSADRRPWADTVLADRVRIGPIDDGGPEPFDANDTDEDPADVDPGDGLAPVDLAFVDTVGPADVVSPDDLDDEPDDEPDDPAVPDDRPPLDVLTDEPADEPAPVDHRHATVLLPDHVRSIDS